MEFIKNSLVLQKCPKSTMEWLPNMPLITATNIVRFALLTILKRLKDIQKSWTVIDTPKYKISHLCVGICG